MDFCGANSMDGREAGLLMARYDVALWLTRSFERELPLLMEVEAASSLEAVWCAMQRACVKRVMHAAAKPLPCGQAQRWRMGGKGQVRWWVCL